MVNGLERTLTVTLTLAHSSSIGTMHASAVSSVSKGLDISSSKTHLSMRVSIVAPRSAVATSLTLAVGRAAWMKPAAGRLWISSADGWTNRRADASIDERALRWRD